MSPRVNFLPLSATDARWALVVALGAILLYSPSLWHGFCLLDDSLYVTANYDAQAGITLSTVRAAITSFSASNWHPLTLLSHALDCSMFGLSPMGHHATNVILHAILTALIYLLVRRLDADRWRAVLIATAFAIHPLQVETVAWVSSRKGLLSTLFVILALWAHAEYSLKGSRRYFLTGLAAAVLAMASKSMAVTLPLLLLIADYWPLRRWYWKSGLSWRANLKELGFLFLEKVPYGALSGICVFLTLWAHETQRLFHWYSWPARLANVFNSYFVYLNKAVWPARLCIYYPHQGEEYSRLWFGFTVALFLVISWLAWRLRQSFPGFTGGWLWYVVSLLPVIGLIPINGNGWADRYAYLPLIGVFWAAGMMIPSGWSQNAVRRRAVRAASAMVLAALTVTTIRQIGYWRTNATLFHRALEVTEKNAVAHACYGASLEENGDLASAEQHLRLALQIEPNMNWARNLLGEMLLSDSRPQDALIEFEKCVAATPSAIDCQCNLASAASMLGQSQRAAAIWSEILSKYPNEPRAHVGLGTLALKSHRLKEAAIHFKNALEIAPYRLDVWKGLALVALEGGLYKEAEPVLLRAFELGPDDEGTILLLARLFDETGRYLEAERVLRQFANRKRVSPRVLAALASCLIQQKRKDEAVTVLKKLVTLQPDNAATLHSLGILLNDLDEPREALAYLEQAARLQPDRPGLKANLQQVQERLANFDHELRQRSGP
ncbi:MAG TPA: tetratricopeptide repeat protein [Acidobacteriota bacterium]|nr:tetratricopeptide repeat protein [Acidobacteriota bacterium]